MDLIKHLSEPLGKKEISRIAADSYPCIDEVIKLCLHSNDGIAFRASWILEGMPDRFPTFIDYLPEFTNTYLLVENASVKRHFTKIMMNLIMAQGMEIFAPGKLEHVIERTFEWLIDPQTPVAVKVNCMDILYLCRGYSDWVGEELGEQIVFQLKTGSAALQSRGKRILGKLRRANFKC